VDKGHITKLFVVLRVADGFMAEGIIGFHGRYPV